MFNSGILKFTFFLLLLPAAAGYTSGPSAWQSDQCLVKAKVSCYKKADSVKETNFGRKLEIYVRKKS
jgi:hypothetical protein